MRICSLLPSATEILFALGLGDQICAVSHECDYPEEARIKPKVLRSFIDTAELSSKEIDELVSRKFREGSPLYRLDIRLLEELEPDLIITQELCEVCSVALGEVVKALEALGSRGRARILSLAPSGLEGVLEDILRIGEATDRLREAEELVSGLRERIERIERRIRASASSSSRPRVLCLEWLDPPIVAGHWIPEMVRIAGGYDGLGKEGRPSYKLGWEEILNYEPDVILLMPCGFGLERAMREAEALSRIEGWPSLKAVREGRVYATNANWYFSRPGPRLVEGLELMAQLLHPELFGPAPEDRARTLSLPKAPIR